MKSMAGTVPYAVALAAAGGAIWWLLSQNMAAGTWLLAGLLVAHGLIHVLFAVPTPSATAGAPEWPFSMARTWPVTAAGLDENVVRSIGRALIVVVAAALTQAGLSTVGIVVPPTWWAALVVTGAVGSAVTLVLLFNPQLFLGLGIDAVLLWVVVAGAWQP